MSFRRLLDRTVTITPRVVTGQDARGGDVVADGTPFQVRAGREEEKSRRIEDLEGRDSQSVTFVYLLAPKTVDRAAYIVKAYDRLTDSGVTFELRGNAEEIVDRGRRRLHHVEATVYRISG